MKLAKISDSHGGRIGDDAFRCVMNNCGLWVPKTKGQAVADSLLGGAAQIWPAGKHFIIQALYHSAAHIFFLSCNWQVENKNFSVISWMRLHRRKH